MTLFRVWLLFVNLIIRLPLFYSESVKTYDSQVMRSCKIVDYMKSRKGQLGGLPGAAMAFVLVGVMLAIGAYILSEINTSAGFTAGSTETNVIGNASAGLLNLGTWLPLIALVIAAGIVIAVLVGSFGMGRAGV